MRSNKPGPPQEFVGGPLDGITFALKNVPLEYCPFLCGYGGVAEGCYDGEWRGAEFKWLWHTNPPEDEDEILR